MSVVIPAYNCAQYLERAVNSVLGQTYQNIECIVINDGSTDDTPQVLEAFGPRVHTITQVNSGASAARNAGIAVSRGRYIAFLDADDYWLPTKIANQIQVLLDNPSLVLISCDFTWASSTTTLAANPLAYAPEQVRMFHDLTQLLRNPYLGTPTVVVATDAVKRINGFDTSLRVGEDVDFYFRLCAGSSYARLDQCLAVFQRRPGSLTTSVSGYADNLAVLDRIERSLTNSSDENHALLKALRLEVYQNWISALLGHGTGQEVRHLLRESRRYGHLSNYRTYYLKSVISPALPALRKLRKILQGHSSLTSETEKSRRTL